MTAPTTLYACAKCQSKTAKIENAKMSHCAMIKCSTCRYHMLLEYPGYDLDTDGVYAEWVAIVGKQMKKAAAKAGKEEFKAFL